MRIRRALPKICCITTEEVGRPDLSALDGLADIHYSCDSGLRAALWGAEAVFLWDVNQIDKLRNNWDLMTGVSWMHVAVTGVDAFQFKELRESQLVLTNAGGIYNDAIAAYVAMAVLAYERRLAPFVRQQEAHLWRPIAATNQIGKNALIIGPGRIGRTVARTLKGLGLHLRGVDVSVHGTDPDFERIDDFRHLKDAIGWADHIVICAPLTDQTRGLINASVLEECKPSAHLINVARGPIVKTDDLIAALKGHRIAGATLDVLEQEPLPQDSPLWDLPGVTITPHIAGEVAGFEGALVDQFVRNARHWLKGEELECVVDKERGYAKPEKCNK